MKKILYFIAVSALLFFGASSAKAEGASMSVSGGGNYNVGATFNSGISLSSGGNRICAVEFTLTYPADLLEATSTPSLGSVYTMSTAAENSAGRIHYQVGSTGCSTDNATLLTVPFRAKAQGDATLSLTDLAAYDGDGANVAVSGSGTTVKISAVVASTSTSTSVSKKKTAASSPVVAPAATIVLVSPTIKSVSFLNSTVDSEHPDVSINNSDEWGLVFMGTADPSVKVNITINSDPISASVQSDESGNWSYALGQKIEDGAHQIIINTEKDSVKSADATADFVLDSTRVALGKTLPEIEAAPVATDIASGKENKPYLTYVIYGGAALVLIGAIIFIVLFIKKRREHAAMLRSMTSFSEPSGVAVNPMEDISQSNQASDVNNNVSQMEQNSVQPILNEQNEAPISQPEPSQQTAPELTVENGVIPEQSAIEHGFGRINETVIANENAKTIPQVDSSQVASGEIQSNMPEQAVVENAQNNQIADVNPPTNAEGNIAINNNSIDQNPIPNNQNLPNSNQGQVS